MHVTHSYIVNSSRLGINILIKVFLAQFLLQHNSKGQRICPLQNYLIWRGFFYFFYVNGINSVNMSNGHGGDFDE